MVSGLTELIGGQVVNQRPKNRALCYLMHCDIRDIKGGDGSLESDFPWKCFLKDP